MGALCTGQVLRNLSYGSYGDYDDCTAVLPYLDISDAVAAH